MKKWGAAICALIIGLGLGLAWKPYTLTTQQLGDAAAIIKANRITGRTWALYPGDRYWQEVTNSPAPDPKDPLGLFK